MRFPIIGFNESHQFRLSAAFAAILHDGGNRYRVDVTENPIDLGKHMICARISGLGVVFTDKEVDDIVKVAKRTESLPQFARQFVDALKDCADGVKAKRLSAAEKAKMI